jgi:predicted MFS family arabinose efflux permease
VTIVSDRQAARLATRLCFLVAGFGVACWAPLIPFAKQLLRIDDGALGLLLLCGGIGSVTAVALTAPLSAKLGTKPAILAGGFGLAVILPLLAVAGTKLALGAALFGFGAALGSLDVAVNVHALEVERASGTPLMSGFHALFSIGGFAGASLMTLLLSWRLAPLAGTLACSVLMAVAMAAAWPRLLIGARGKAGNLFVMPRGIVALLAGLAAATFLAEGAMLDWSALLVTGRGLVAAKEAGIGYMLFAFAATLGRLAGDTVTARIGDRAILFWSGMVCVAGFVVLLAAPVAGLAMAGFLLIGLGAANIVPVLFRRAGAQTAVPSALAVGAITTTGYAGMLAGPACIGFIAKAFGLGTAFWMLALLMLLIPLTSGLVAPREDRM